MICLVCREGLELVAVKDGSIVIVYLGKELFFEKHGFFFPFFKTILEGRVLLFIEIDETF